MILWVTLIGIISAGRPPTLTPSLASLAFGLCPPAHQGTPVRLTSAITRPPASLPSSDFVRAARSSAPLPLRLPRRQQHRPLSMSSLPTGPGVVVFSTPGCKYCAKAKARLGELGVPYTDIDVGANSALRASVKEAAGGRTSVPQIFVAGEHVGGCDDLFAEEESGALGMRLREAGIEATAPSAPAAGITEDGGQGIDLGPVNGVLNFHEVVDRAAGGGVGVEEVVGGLQRRVLEMFDQFLTRDGRAVDFKRMRGSKVLIPAALPIVCLGEGARTALALAAKSLHVSAPPLSPRHCQRSIAHSSSPEVARR